MAKKRQQEEPAASEVDTLLDEHRRKMQPHEREEFDSFFDAMDPKERVEFMEGLAKGGAAAVVIPRNLTEEIPAGTEMLGEQCNVKITQVAPVSGKDDPLLGQNDLAEMFCVSGTTIGRWLNEGWLPYFQVGPSRLKKVRKSDAERELSRKRQNLLAPFLPSPT